MDELRVLSLDDAAALRTRVEAVSDALYRRIATTGHKEKVIAGAAVHTAGFALPLARAAGVLDELITNHGFNDLHPTAEGAYDTIGGGRHGDDPPAVPHRVLGRAAARRPRVLASIFRNGRTVIFTDRC